MSLRRQSAYHSSSEDISLGCAHRGALLSRGVILMVVDKLLRGSDVNELFDKKKWHQLFSLWLFSCSLRPNDKTKQKK